jgi:hypothetical protein
MTMMKSNTLSHAENKKPKQKPSLRKSRSQHPKQKTVQWKNTEEVKNYHPNHPVSQAQLPGNMFHPNYLDTAPFQLPQQQINVAPIQTLHHNPMQRNTPNPFQPFIQTQNNLTYTNPFGTSQTLHPQSQYKK